MKKTPQTFTPPVRGLKAGMHPFLDLLPRATESPALRLIATGRFPGAELVRDVRVAIVPETGFCWVDDAVPCIVLALSYYQTGSDLDLYLDLWHELTHIRQILEGRDVWDEAYAYHQRPTEIEGYAVAVSEARRVGLNEAEILEHLRNPWMSETEIRELFGLVSSFLAETATR
jgi:hypothetical protein